MIKFNNLAVSEMRNKVRNYNYILFKDNDSGVVIENNKRYVYLLSEKGKVRRKYSDIDTVYSTFESKSNRGCLELLQKINNSVVSQIDGYVKLKNGDTHTFEDFIDNLEIRKVI